jgi:hypothetical protein
VPVESQEHVHSHGDLARAACTWRARADVLERCVPGFQRGNFVDVILNSDWPE